MVRAAKEKFGGLDVLINNAGIGATGHFADSSPDVLRSIMETNFFGTVETTRAFLPILTEGKTPAVVNVSSILGRRAIPGRSLYSASKFAIEGWTQAVRAEFARFDIDVITVNPGLTQTNFSQNMLEKKAKQSLDHMRGMTPDQVAAATLDALAAGKKVVNLTFQGKALLFANRFLPGLGFYFEPVPAPDTDLITGIFIFCNDPFKVFFFGGLVIFLTALLTSGTLLTVVFLIIAITTTIIPAVYSYMIYRKEKETIKNNL